MNFKEKTTELNTAMAEVRAYHDELEVKEKEGTLTQEERNKLEEMIKAGRKLRKEWDDMKFIQETTDLLNKPASERASKSGAPRGPLTWGEMVTGSDELKNRRGDYLDRVKVGSIRHKRESKAIYGSLGTAGGVLAFDDMQPGVINRVPQMPTSVMDLVNRSRTNSDAVRYLLMTARTNAAAVVSERTATGGGPGDDVFGLKPESNMTFSEEVAPVKTIATWVGVSKQILEDAPRLEDTINNELTYMVERTLEDQILNGPGTGNTFTGILVTPGVQTRTQGGTTNRGLATDTVADVIRRAITDIRLEFYEATGIVMNPAAGERLELTKDTTNNYVNVYDPVASRVWRVPVVETAAIGALKVLVGNFRLGATLWDRQQTEILTGQPNDYFLRNAYALLAELRAAFAVTRPKAFEVVTLV